MSRRVSYRGAEMVNGWQQDVPRCYADNCERLGVWLNDGGIRYCGPHQARLTRRADGTPRAVHLTADEMISLIDAIVHRRVRVQDERVSKLEREQKTWWQLDLRQRRDIDTLQGDLVVARTRLHTLEYWVHHRWRLTWWLGIVQDRIEQHLFSVRARRSRRRWMLRRSAARTAA